MMERDFPTRSEMIGERRCTVQVVTCGMCGKEESMAVKTRTPKFPPQVVAAHFRHKGWIIGSRPKDDVCPVCVVEAEEARRIKARKEKLELPPKGAAVEAVKLVPIQSKPNGTRVADGVKTVIDRDARRILFAKLNEVYLDERRGYAPGWTDAKVAADLGISIDLVAAERDQFFGPEDPTHGLRDKIAEAQAALIDMAARGEALLDVARRAQEAAADISRKADALRAEIRVATAELTKPNK